MPVTVLRKYPQYRKNSDFSLGLSFIFLVLIAMNLSACARDKIDRPEPVEGTYQVDDRFRSLYDQLGGEKILGPAISPVIQSNNVYYQYTTAALLVNDPKAQAGEQLKLAPLGRDMAIRELSVTPPADPAARYLAGHQIAAEFISLFDQLGGEAVVGKPLGEARTNGEMKRIEQYFENLGFYRPEDNPGAPPALLAYGAWKCDAACRQAAPTDSVILLPSRTAAPFVDAVNKLGAEFTGYALTEPYLSPDGKLEQIYENVVLTINPEYPKQAVLRDLPEKLGIAADAPALNNLDPETIFFRTSGELGYNISQQIYAYLERHGGLEISGAPITQLQKMDNLTYRQCFSNLCMARVQDSSGAFSVRPVSLGLTYRQLFYQPASSTAVPETSQALSLQIWESYPMVNQQQSQEIGVGIFGGNVPLPDLQPELVVTLPGGQQMSYTLPPTNEEGETRLSLPPIPAENGTLIPYQVCVNTFRQQQFCVMDSYLIWSAEGNAVSPALSGVSRQYLPLIVKTIRIYLPLVMKTFELYLPVMIQQ